MRRRLSVLACLLSFAASLPGAFPTLHLKPVVLQQLYSPTTITHAGDGSGRVFVCDQPGRIWIIQGGMMLPVPFLDLTASAVPQTTGYSERGLLGLAFHPDFDTPSAPGEGKFYVYYSAPSMATSNPSVPQEHVSVVSEFSVSAMDANAADPLSERILLTFGQPQSNHNGGQLAFGPDGMLYIGTGDGGGADDNDEGHTGGSSSKPSGGLGNSQDLTKLLGKILRLDPLGTSGPGGQYGIPVDNPFVGAGSGTREEIYAYGLRNPWRFSFDSRPGGTGRLFCADVGQVKVEEVNLIVSGGNYGWRYREGNSEFDPAMVGAGTAPASSIAPIAEYAHPGVTIGSPTLPQLGVSVTGGMVYRGSAIPALQGKYLFGDYRAASGMGGRLMGLEETAPLSGSFVLTQAVPLTGPNPLDASQRILTLGEDEAGEIFIGTKSNGGVLQLAAGYPAGGIYQVVAATPGSSVVSAAADTVLFQEDGTLSNGVGPFLFAGNTAGGNGYAPRRSLLRFDLSAVPAGAVVSSASLALYMDKTIVGSLPFSLHRATRAWGEGSSNAGDPGGTGAPAEVGDATWTFSAVTSPSPSISGTTWTAPGGDFDPTASATINVNSNGSYAWSGASVVADVNAWLSTPSSNFGWLLKGAEAPSTTEAKRFGSRQHPTPARRPALSLTYAVPPPLTPFESFLATYFPAALVGEFINPAGDLDGDGIALLVEYAYGYSPLSYNAPASTGFTVTPAPGAAGSTDLTLTFRRNPGATDVTLNLQVGSELTGWTIIAQSLGGATPVGINGGTVVSDNAISGQSPNRLTTVTLNLPAGVTRQFARLEIIRPAP
ncbi:MAG: PQQ-dependent sugar dehydrogenase [Verrucomicrobiales bacterium]|nr:PQQ-dependent sugar dehydrogenase [Verrucomicrobiales bacterium]